MQQKWLLVCASTRLVVNLVVKTEPRRRLGAGSVGF
jgi:hypothetical protein